MVGNESSGVSRHVAARRYPMVWKIPLFSFPMSEVRVGDLDLAVSQCGERGWNLLPRCQCHGCVWHILPALLPQVEDLMNPAVSK